VKPLSRTGVTALKASNVEPQLRTILGLIPDGVQI